MIGCDDQRRRIRERFVARQHRRVHVPVRRHDGERAGTVVQLARKIPGCWIRIEVAILVEFGHTTGFHRGSYSRLHRRDASASFRMCPFFGSVVNLRPTCCEMVPRRQSVPVFAPSSIGADSGVPVRTALVKFSMWSAVSQSSPIVLSASPFGAAFTSLTTLFLRS